MARDKAKDDKNFNCSQEHEIKYVSSLYRDSDTVRKWLVKWCDDNTIKNMTHKEVYELIQKKLGYIIPD